MKNLTDRWNKQAKKVLLGKKIVQVKYVDSEEAEKYMWYLRPVSFTLDDGTRLVVMRDDEGNDGGALCYLNDDVDDVLPVLSLGD
jgi:hypothetical protein